MTDLMFLESVVRMPLMALPVRTTVVTVSNAKIMISPGSQLSKEEIQKAESVTDIVAPCLLHTGGIKNAHEVFPRARIWGPKGAAQVKAEIPWTHELDENTWPYHDELKLIEIQGIPRNKECVFVHKKSKCLIVADLFFNMGRPPGMGAWVILHVFGTYGKFAVSRLFLNYVTDREAFAISAQKILEEDFEHIAVGHGHLFDGGPVEALKAFQERGFKL